MWYSSVSAIARLTGTSEFPVQRKRALVLQQEWGDKPCDHPAFAKEYDLGERTGNFICTQCGKSITFKERAELLAARGKTNG
jgi:hypothetical protein